VVAVDLEGRAAFVTGAGHGIGRAIAVRLAEAGARVVVHYRSDREGAEETAAQAGRFAEATCESADLTDPDDVDRVLDRPIDILINNAGAYPAAPLLDMLPSQWTEINHANTDTAFLALRAAARTMIRQVAAAPS
jgi:NAD(P)-dependent dehydrogenase (short-subunit alcohol dehydrogenase family)